MKALELNKKSTLTTALYWGSTVLLSLMMLMSVFMYFTNAEVIASFAHLGFPTGYFRIELGIFKLLGVIVLLAPGLGRVKEWAYAGFGITFISAFTAHVSSGDPIQAAIAPVFAFVLLTLSYLTFRSVRNLKSN